MTRDEVIAAVMDVIAETFDAPGLAYADTLTANDVEGWDSLSNIRFMVAIEQAFGRRLTMTEWQGLDCLGDLVGLLTTA